VRSASEVVTMKRLGETFVGALSRQNWTELQSCFADGVQFRALIPPGVREAADAATAAGYFSRWFGDADQLIVLEADVRPVEDRLSISYRLRAHEDRWYLIEQRAYCDVRDDRIERMDLLCSGFQPEAT
jgi:hypothetical protein